VEEGGGESEKTGRVVLWGEEVEVWVSAEKSV
jgi:hypothetical protein